MAIETEKLNYCVSAINGRFHLSLALVQVWASSSDDALALEKKGQQKVVLSTDALPCSINDEGLRQFRVKSCEQGISSAGLGMLGKVWSTGALQVVQNVAIIPQSVHPRNKLDSSLARLVSELIYIPVYDLALPEDGVLAVLELVVSTHAQEDQIVGNVISYVSNILDELQLSLAKPEEPAELPDFEMAPRSPPQSAAPLRAASPSTSPPRRSMSLSRTTSIRCLLPGGGDALPPVSDVLARVV